MSGQIVGYYNSRKNKLLKDFDQTASLLKSSLIARYGEALSSTLQNEARCEYEKLIPEIPYIKGFRARMLNTFLLITAQELAVYKSLQRHGKTPAEAWELCHEALRLRLEQVPQWKRWLLKRLMFSTPVRKIVAKRARQHQRAHFGEFEVEYLVAEGNAFDVGVNYHQCGHYRFAMEHGSKAFAPFICMSDIALSYALGWGLTRTQTLADGCDFCDFRMKKGAKTQISSKTPEVQATIEKIRIMEDE